MNLPSWQDKYAYITVTSLSPCYSLMAEVAEINYTIAELQSQLRSAENTLQQLLRSKAQLEQDLSVKNNSLFIDREKCMGMRKTFPMSPRIASYWCSQC